jgi:hypothetical protein
MGGLLDLSAIACMRWRMSPRIAQSPVALALPGGSGIVDARRFCASSLRATASAVRSGQRRGQEKFSVVTEIS